jgi:hypothetical protein
MHHQCPPLSAMRPEPLLFGSGTLRPAPGQALCDGFAKRHGDASRSSGLSGPHLPQPGQPDYRDRQGYRADRGHSGRRNERETQQSLGRDASLPGFPSWMPMPTPRLEDPESALISQGRVQKSSCRRMTARGTKSVTRAKLRTLGLPGRTRAGTGCRVSSKAIEHRHGDLAPVRSAARVCWYLSGDDAVGSRQNRRKGDAAIVQFRGSPVRPADPGAREPTA